MNTFNITLKSIAIALITYATTISHADTVSWVRYAPGCEPDQTQGQLHCGAFGSFQFSHISNNANCPKAASGDEEFAAYPRPSRIGAFDPIEPEPVRTLTLPPLEKFPKFLTWQSSDIGADDIEAETHSETAKIHYLDFFGIHSNSVAWLGNAVANLNTRSRPHLLDGQDGSTPVTDREVLKHLCTIAQSVDVSGAPPPQVINMSFGRALNQFDPTDAANCANHKISCQLAKLIAHLSEKGSLFVAAGSKDRQPLFPASVKPVIAVGTLDPTLLVNAQSLKATWEMSDALDALMPGHALCLRGGWSAPSGTSYASTIMSGWLHQAIVENPGVKLNEVKLWRPKFSHTKNCHVLDGDGTAYTGCNEQIELLLNGVSGANSQGCWNTPTVLSAVATLGEATSQPELRPALTWSPSPTPAPESDPCIPCTEVQYFVAAPHSASSVTSRSSELVLNLANTTALPELQAVESVHLRIGSDFYPVELDGYTKSLMTEGDLDQLTLLSNQNLFATDKSMSLFFRIRRANAQDCTNTNACAWRATHIHRPNLQGNTQ